jgi:hypothetical protein
MGTDERRAPKIGAAFQERKENFFTKVVRGKADRAGRDFNPGDLGEV